MFRQLSDGNLQKFIKTKTSPLRISKSLNFHAHKEDLLLSWWTLRFFFTTDWKISLCLLALRFNSTFDTLIFRLTQKKNEFSPFFAFSNSMFQRISIDTLPNANRKRKTPNGDAKTEPIREKKKLSLLSITIFYCVNISCSMSCAGAEMDAINKFSSLKIH